MAAFASWCCGSVMSVPPGRRMPAFSRAISVIVVPSHSVWFERDVGDDRGERVDDVGGIQTPTQADFEHRDLHIGLSESEERECGNDLKETWRVGQFALGDKAGCSVIHLEVEPGKSVVVDLGQCICARRAKRSLHPLVHPQQVRRGIQAGPCARNAQDAGERGRRGTLAVGAGDQHGREALLRIAQRSGQHAHVIQIELAARRTGRRGGKLTAQRVQVLDRCCVGHVDDCIDLRRACCLKHGLRVRQVTTNAKTCHSST